jgi:hypothetical protein
MGVVSNALGLLEKLVPPSKRPQEIIRANLSGFGPTELEKINELRAKFIEAIAVGRSV